MTNLSDRTTSHPKAKAVSLIALYTEHSSVDIPQFRYAYEHAHPDVH